MAGHALRDVAIPPQFTGLPDSQPPLEELAMVSQVRVLGRLASSFRFCMSMVHSLEGNDRCIGAKAGTVVYERCKLCQCVPHPRHF